jgi:FixJ family two-component response regulator
MTTTLRYVLAAEGWDVRVVRVERPLLAVPTWGKARLVILLGGSVTGGATLLDMLAATGYEGPFLLMAPKLTADVRRRAIVRGALDVITLPADAYPVQARVQAALQALQLRIAPPAP